jgi:hypothetical protein
MWLFLAGVICGVLVLPLLVMGLILLALAWAPTARRERS